VGGPRRLFGTDGIRGVAVARVDRQIGACRLEGGDLDPRPCGRDDTGAHVLAERDRGEADARRARVYEKGFSPSQGCFAGQVDERRQPGLGYRRRVDERQRRRRGKHLPFGDRDELRVSAPGQKRADFFARVEPDARDFHARDQRLSGRRRIPAG